MDICPTEALRLDTTDGVVAEIVMLPAPTPALTIPAPDTFKRFENVPVELLVVLPTAVSDTDDVLTPLIDTVPPVVLIANPPATEYVGPKIESTLLVVLPVPVVVLCDNPIIDTACR
jgi:hypothetical protein